MQNLTAKIYLRNQIKNLIKIKKPVERLRNEVKNEGTVWA
jgi:hypothetical protein